MKNIEIIQYEPIHAYTILDQNVREQDLQLSQNPDWEEWIKGWKTAGPSYTLVIDGEIIGCAGIVLVGWQRGEAWALLSSLFYRYKKTAYKAIKNGLDKIVKDKGLRRIQTLVKPNFECGRRMMEHLGFENETPNGMKNYGPNGETFLMFSKIRRSDG